MKLQRKLSNVTRFQKTIHPFVSYNPPSNFLL
jgi:hypothetical protein